MKPDARKCRFKAIRGNASQPRQALRGSAREQVRASPASTEGQSAPRARRPEPGQTRQAPGTPAKEHGPPEPGSRPRGRQQPEHASSLGGRGALIHKSGLRALCAGRRPRQ